MHRAVRREYDRLGDSIPTYIAIILIIIPLWLRAIQYGINAATFEMKVILWIIVIALRSLHYIPGVVGERGVGDYLVGKRDLIAAERLKLNLVFTVVFIVVVNWEPILTLKVFHIRSLNGV